MMRAGGGGTSTQCDLLGSPGWQEKLKHYLLNHVRVETNICWPSVQPSDLSELLATSMSSASFLLSHLIASWLSPLPQGLTWEGVRRLHGAQGQHYKTPSKHAATEVIVKPAALGVRDCFVV